MPQIKDVTIGYTERRSCNFQTVEVSETVTYSPLPGEDENQVREEKTREICRRVRANADKAIARYEPK